MTFKVTNLAKTFPEYDSNKRKTYLFAYAGADYLYASEMLIEGRNKDGRWCMWAEMPLMHMAIELLVKAFASYYDQKFNGKKARHKTSQIIKDYSDKIGIFKKISDEPKNLELIKELEKSWELVRYGEGAQRCDGEEYKILKNIAGELYNEYKKITKLPYL